MFQCVVCKGYVSETHRIFEGLDWCPTCIRKDGNILARENNNINPSYRVPNMPEPLKRYESQKLMYLVSRPPYYALYQNIVPENIRKKIIKG